MSSSIPARRPARVLIAVLAAALMMAGCTAQGQEPVPTSAAPSATPTEATAPALVPDGSAADNLPVFTAVMDEVWAGESRVQGQAYVDALVAAGFDKQTMELTPDRTSVGDPVDSLMFSVLWQGQCLVGQVGPSLAAPVAQVLDPVPTGTCLIGHTRPIDW